VEGFLKGVQSYYLLNVCNAQPIFGARQVREVVIANSFTFFS
jgi:hypothetical protein